MASRLKDRAKFDSFADFESALYEYEKANKVKMIKRDSKKMKEKGRQEDEPEDWSQRFPYIYAMYRCRYSGRPRRKAATARKRLSIKQDCPAFIYIKVDRKRQHYEVDGMDMDHNHDVSESHKENIDELDGNIQIQDYHQTEKRVQDICSVPSSTPPSITQTLLEDHQQREVGVQDIGPLINTSHSIMQTQTQASHQTENGQQDIGVLASSTSQGITQTQIHDSYLTEDREQDIDPVVRSTFNGIHQAQIEHSQQAANGEQDIGYMASSTSHSISQTQIQDSYQTEDGEQASRPMASSTSHDINTTGWSHAGTSNKYTPWSSMLTICGGTELIQTQSSIKSAGQLSLVKGDDISIPSNASSHYESPSKAPQQASLPRSKDDIHSTGISHHLKTSSKPASNTSQCTENGESQGDPVMSSGGSLSLDDVVSINRIDKSRENQEPPAKRRRLSDHPPHHTQPGNTEESRLWSSMGMKMSQRLQLVSDEVKVLEDAKEKALEQKKYAEGELCRERNAREKLEQDLSLEKNCRQTLELELKMQKDRFQRLECQAKASQEAEAAAVKRLEGVENELHKKKSAYEKQEQELSRAKEELCRVKRDLEQQTKIRKAKDEWLSRSIKLMISARDFDHSRETGNHQHPNERGNHPSVLASPPQPPEAGCSPHPSEPGSQSHPPEPGSQPHPSETGSQPHPYEPGSQSHPSEPGSQPHPYEPGSHPHPSEPGSQPHPSETGSQPHPSEPGSQPHPSEPGSQPHPSEPGSQPHPYEPGSQSHPYEPGSQSHPYEPGSQSHPSEPRSQPHPSETGSHPHPSETGSQPYLPESGSCLDPHESKSPPQSSYVHSLQSPPEPRSPLQPLEPGSHPYPLESGSHSFPSESRSYAHSSQSGNLPHPSESGIYPCREPDSQLHLPETESLHPQNEYNQLLQFPPVATDVGDSSGRRRDVPIHDSPKNHCNNSASTEISEVQTRVIKKAMPFLVETLRVTDKLLSTLRKQNIFDATMVKDIKNASDKWGKVYQFCLHLCWIGNRAYQALLDVLSKQQRLKRIAEHLQQIEKNENPNHPKFGCPAQSDDDSEEMDKIHKCIMKNRKSIAKDMTITYQFLAYFVRAGMLEIQDAINVMEGSRNVDEFLDIIHPKLGSNPYVLFIALTKTSQQDVLKKTEECWRKVEIKGGLYEGASCGRVLDVWLQLELGCVVDEKGANGCTALVGAVHRGHRDVAKILLGHNADINVCDNYGCTELMGAALEGHRDMVQILLKHGADINDGDDDGRTALMHAAHNGHRDVVEILIKHSADINVSGNDGRTALMYAACNGHRDVVEILLEHRADINVSDTLGRTALADAAFRGRQDVVEILLPHCADINVSDKNGRTALIAAANNGHRDVVEILLEHDAGINVSENDGRTALVHAAFSGHQDVVEILLRHCADINVSDKDGGTALMAAADKGHRDVVRILLEHNADINARDMDGRTALMDAAYAGHRDVVKILLEHSADISVSDNNGKTALVKAADMGHTGVVELLQNSSPQHWHWQGWWDCSGINLSKRHQGPFY